MSEYQAHIRWSRASNEAFTDSRYSRAHTWEFDGGIIVPGSSSVHSVPLPYSKPENVDPEEAFIAAISSCHMLVFLYLAAKAKFVIDSYDDLAIGRMTKNARGRLAVTHTRLEPNIVLSGANVPSDSAIKQLHHDAHEECYIANSVLTEITVGGTWSHVR